MKLSRQEIGMGICVSICKCCGNIYKTHVMANACAYSFTPNFGCSECQGIIPEKSIAKIQAWDYNRKNRF